MGVYFNGRYIIKPSVATYVDDSALTPAGLVGSNVIGMIGPAKDGVPNQAYLITATSDALDIFKEGPLVDGISMAFQQGAQFIWAARVSGTWDGSAFASLATQSSYSVGGSPNIPFKLESVSYGKHTDNISVNSKSNATAGIDISVTGDGNTISAVGLNNNCVAFVSADANPMTLNIAANAGAYELTITDGTATVGYVDISNVSGQFVVGDNLAFSPSGATAIIAPDGTGSYPTVGATKMYFTTLSGTPTASDTITGSLSSQTADCDSTAYLGNKTGIIDLLEISNMIDLKTSLDYELSKALPNAITTLTVSSTSDTTPGIELDAGSFTLAAGSTTYIKNNVKVVYDWLNSGAQPYVNADDVSNIFTTAVDKDISLLDVADPGSTFVLTGGSYGSLDATAYQGVLSQVYEDLDLDLMVPIVDDYLTYSITTSCDAIFNYIFTHCKEMSTIKSEERIGLIGYMIGASSMSTDTDVDDRAKLEAKALTFNTPHMVVCAPRIKNYNLKGILKTFNGTYTAASIAGMIANYPVGEPITHKVVEGINGLSKEYRNAEILQLIDNGICTIEKVRGVGYRVVQGVTSWVATDNFNKKEISVRLVTNYVAKNCRESLDQYIGRKNSPFVLETIKGTLVGVLRELENEEIIVGTVDYPAFRSLVLTSDGDVVRVSFECSPVLPINYITIRINATIFKATI